MISAGGLRPGERVLVVVDEPLTVQGAELAAAVKDAGGEPELVLWAGERPFMEPHPAAAAAAEAADLCIFISKEPRSDEAGARIALNDILRAHGGREIYSGLVDPELLDRELSNEQPDLAQPASRLLAELEGSRALRLRGGAGTDLVLRVAGRTWETDATPIEAGGFNNYPNGEVFIAPLEDSAEGVLVVDLTVPYTVDGLVDEPVLLRFEGGSVQSIEGGRAAEMLRELVDEAGPSGRVIAELGIGFNPTISPWGHVLFDEKAAGTAHVAIGNNTGQYGGVNESTIHVDCVFSKPELEADGKRIELPSAS
ncbi:MAG TPA: aminopeptidase [Gaiellaceae bacterium]|nr:aminopeptidase [Gaiellaceae bacterium]